MKTNRLRLSKTTLACLALAALAAAILLAADERTRSLALNTLKLIGGTLAISLPFGALVGALIARTDLPLRRVAAAAIGLLLIVPLYLQAAAWQSGFGPYGWFTLAFGGSSDPWLWKWRGAIFVHAMAAVPWVALFVGLAARQVEPQLEEAALLDAPAWRVFCHVTVRRIWPAVGLAGIWVALLVATDMTVTDLYQVRTYAEEVYVDFAAPTDIHAAPLGPWIGALVASALTAGAIMLCAWAAQYSTRLLPRKPIVFALGRWRWPATAITACVLFVLFGVPIFSLFYKAGVVTHPTATGATRSWSIIKCLHIIATSPARYQKEFGLSFLLAAVAAAIALALSIPLAWLAKRGGLCATPAVLFGATALAIPAPLLGIGLINLFNGPSVTLNWMYDTIAAPIIGQTIRALPLALFISWLAFRSIPHEQLEAAALDGAGARSRFFRVAVPQRWPALAAVWLAAFLVAFNELPATLLLQPPGTMTLPVQIYQLMHGNGEDLLAGIVLFLILAYAIVGATAFALLNPAGREAG
jgi:iron(III) transport system permease protein